MQIETFTHARPGGWSTPCLPALDSEQTAVLVFAAPEYGEQPAVFAELAARYPRSAIVGCSAAGAIADTSLLDEALSVAVVRFDGARVAAARAPVAVATDSYRAAVTIARALTAPDLRGVLVFSDGLLVNGSDLVRGFNAVLPPAVVVCGGLAADGDRFTRTWVLDGGVPRSGVVTALGLYGDRVRVGHGSKGGWDIFGPERRVTRAAGNILYELDGKPALDLYKTYLGERAADLPASGLLFPLAVRADRAEAARVVRTILAVDEATRSLVFAGDLPVGSFAQLMRANFDRLIDGASDAASELQGHAPTGPALCVAISCVGRRLVLGERAEEELEATVEALPAGVRQVGFYSYGEIAPSGLGSCELHNQTMTLTTISEDC